MREIRAYHIERMSINRMYKILRKTKKAYGNEDVLNFYDRLHEIDLLSHENPIVFSIHELPLPAREKIERQVRKKIEKRIMKIESMMEMIIEDYEDFDKVTTNMLRDLHEEKEMLTKISSNQDIVVEILRP